MQSGRYSCHILIKLEFSQQIFEKYSDIKFYENLSRGNGVVSWGQTEMTELTAAIYCFAIMPKEHTTVTRGTF